MNLIDRSRFETKSWKKKEWENLSNSNEYDPSKFIILVIVHSFIFLYSFVFFARFSALLLPPLENFPQSARRIYAWLKNEMNNGQWIVKISLENRVVKGKIWHFLDAPSLPVFRQNNSWCRRSEFRGVEFSLSHLFFLASTPCNVFIGWNEGKRKRKKERERDLQSLLSRQQQGRRTSSVQSSILRDYAMNIYIYIPFPGIIPLLWNKRSFLERFDRRGIFPPLLPRKFFPNVAKIIVVINERSIFFSR